MASTKRLTILEPAFVNGTMYPAGPHDFPVEIADKIIAGSPQIIQRRKGQDYVEATIEKLLQTSAAELPSPGTLVPGGGDQPVQVNSSDQLLNSEAARPAQDPIQPRNETRSRPQPS